MRKYLLVLSILCCNIYCAEPQVVKDTTQIEVTFAPGPDPEAMIVKHIDAASNRVWIQAYNFTSIPIAEAMIAAKKRGVDVLFVGDRSVRTESKSALETISEGHIPCWLDSKHPIAHNKIVIIDDNLVGCGSFNFSAHALKNAENFIFVTSKIMNKAYDVNFTLHRQHSDAYEGKAP